MNSTLLAAAMLIVTFASAPLMTEGAQTRARPDGDMQDLTWTADNVVDTESDASDAQGKKSSCRPHHVGWAVGGPADGYGMILRTDDSGGTWARQGGVGTIPDITFNGVSAVDKKNAWVVGGKVILRTRDGGMTWEQQSLPADMPPDVELFQVKALDRRTAFAVGYPGVLLGTTDGATWTRLPTSPDLPPVNYQDVDAFDKRYVWAVGGVITGPYDRAGLAIAFYDGKQWRPQLITHETAGSCNAFIGVSAADRRTVWAVGGGDCPPYKTVDGGATWRKGDHPVAPGIYDTNRVVGVNRDLVWIAHDFGLFRTMDGGRTWEETPSDCWEYCHNVSAAGTTCAWASNSQPPGYLYRWVDGDHWESQPVPSQSVIQNLSFVGARR